MIWLVAGVAGLLLAWLLLRAVAHASVAQVKRGAVWLLAGLLLALAGLLLLSGRAPALLGLLIPLAPMLLPALRRWRARRRFAAPEQDASAIRTATLAMRLDHASGNLSGRVLAGRWAGRELGEMSRADWLALLRDCQAQDPESVPLLEHWLDHAAPGWRDDATPPPQALNRAAALALLGLAEGATPAAIRAAHRQRMRAAHPDHGGDPALAARLNQARDVLL